MTGWTHQDSSRQCLSGYHDSGPVFDRGHPAHLAGRHVVLVGALDAIACDDPMDLLMEKKDAEGNMVQNQTLELNRKWLVTSSGTGRIFIISYWHLNVCSGEDNKNVGNTGLTFNFRGKEK